MKDYASSPDGLVGYFVVPSFSSILGENDEEVGPYPTRAEAREVGRRMTALYPDSHAGFSIRRHVIPSVEALEADRRAARDGYNPSR